MGTRRNTSESCRALQLEHSKKKKKKTKKKGKSREFTSCTSVFRRIFKEGHILRFLPESLLTRRALCVFRRHGDTFLRLSDTSREKKIYIYRSILSRLSASHWLNVMFHGDICSLGAGKKKVAGTVSTRGRIRKGGVGGDGAERRAREVNSRETGERESTRHATGSRN